MSPQDEFLLKALEAAKYAEHVFPAYAAAEAALESRWGRSQLAISANNLFGRKASRGDDPSTYTVMSTREFLHGTWITTPAYWRKFSNWNECFQDRMALLERLPKLYRDALEAPDGESFVTLVSQHWSTDPDRAKKVLEIYRAHEGVLNGN